MLAGLSKVPGHKTFRCTPWASRCQSCYKWMDSCEYYVYLKKEIINYLETGLLTAQHSVNVVTADLVAEYIGLHRNGVKPTMFVEETKILRSAT